MPDESVWRIAVAPLARLYAEYLADRSTHHAADFLAMRDREETRLLAAPMDLLAWVEEDDAQEVVVQLAVQVRPPHGTPVDDLWTAWLRAEKALTE